MAKNSQKGRWNTNIIKNELINKKGNNPWSQKNTVPLKPFMEGKIKTRVVE